MNHTHLTQVVSIYLQELCLRSKTCRAMPLVLEQTLQHTHVTRLGLLDLHPSVAVIIARSLDTRHHGCANCDAFCRLCFLYVAYPTQTLCPGGKVNTRSIEANAAQP